MKIFFFALASVAMFYQTYLELISEQFLRAGAFGLMGLVTLFLTVFELIIRGDF
ncbi:MAG: hypothetical protein ACE3JP_03340 [Ectobacillus sp.]